MRYFEPWWQELLSAKVHDQAKHGGFNMQRLALGLTLTSASLLACAMAALLPCPAVAFDTKSEAGPVPGDSTQFQDPDEKPLPAPLSAPKLEEDGTNLQMAPGTNSPGTSLQLAPGTSLQISAGPTTGLQPGFQMAPMINSSNPADDRTLIPSP
jgi:hypothetical protein